MRLLYLGDVMGRTGRDAAIDALPMLRDRLRIDFAAVNVENAAHGFGVTARICDALFRRGADVLTLGNHAWDRRELLGEIDAMDRVIRPLNYPDGTPGRGAVTVALPSGARVGVAQIMGRVFMDPLDCPFRAIDKALKRLRLGKDVAALLVDIHAEATSEKMAMGHYLDGRASAVIGTHSHVPTADGQILPGGTAYQTDTGMCGDYNSVIGMKSDIPVRRFVTRLPAGRFEPAEGPATVCGVLIETDDTTGLARRIEPVRMGGRLRGAVPTG